MIESTETEIRDYTGVTTEQMVVEQLTENTGRGLCDSGDAYGRNWQRNQGRKFAEEPSSTVRWDAWRKQDEAGPGKLEPETNVSLYHWMLHNLEFDAEMQVELDEFTQQEDQAGTSWLGVQEEFAEYISKRDEHEASPSVTNTYNDTDECHLNQVLQYVAVFAEGEYAPSHLIVSVHGGCDVRGGYSSPRCYRLKSAEWEYTETMKLNLVYAGDFHWDYSDGCWRYLNDSNCTQVPDLFKLPCLKAEWIESDETLATEVAIALCAQQALALDGTQLDEAIRERHKGDLRLRQKALEDELMQKVCETAQEQYGDCVIVTSAGKAFLCIDDEPLELKASNYYL